jgi:hypothetical protein
MMGDSLGKGGSDSGELPEPMRTKIIDLVPSAEFARLKGPAILGLLLRMMQPVIKI